MVRMLLLLTLFFTGCRSQGQIPKVVPEVDLERYAGKWYDLCSKTGRFQQGCSCTTAEYTLNPKGFVEVVNTCLREGKRASIRGKAFPVKASGNAKLKVQFFWPFRADYWIVRLDKDYQWAVVSGPSKKYIWLLSRSPSMDENKLQSILNSLKAEGYPVEKMERIQQECP